MSTQVMKLKPSFIGKIKFKLSPYLSGNRSYQANFQVRSGVLEQDYWTTGMERTVRLSKLRLDALHLYDATIEVSGLAEYGLGLHVLGRDNDQELIARFILTHLQPAVDPTTGLEYAYWKHYFTPSKQDYFVSGMGQGLMLSFFCRFNLQRAWPEVEEAIERIANSFLLTAESKDGFVNWSGSESAVIEEYPADPTKLQVLNGWCYGICGLLDYLNYRKVVPGHAVRLDEKRQLLECTLDTLRRALPKYDLGFWSLYNIPRADEKIANIASYHYHDVHIALMEALWNITGENIYKDYAWKFQKYASSPLKRVRALCTKIVFSNILKYGYVFR